MSFFFSLFVSALAALGLGPSPGDAHGGIFTAQPSPNEAHGGIFTDPTPPVGGVKNP